MATLVRDVMTEDPIVLPTTASARTAAERMRDADVGVIVVEENGEVWGVLTDRDLVVRVVAGTVDADSVTIAEVATADVHTVAPDDPVADVVELMRERAIRRVPVVEQGSAVGMISLGDLAERRDPASALGEISDAGPNN